MSALDLYRLALMAVALGWVVLFAEALFAAFLPSWWFGIGPRVVDESWDGAAALIPMRDKPVRSVVGRMRAVSETEVLVTGPGSLLTLDLGTPLPMVGRLTVGANQRLAGWLPLGALIILAGLVLWTGAVFLLVKDDLALLVLSGLAGVSIAGLCAWLFRYERNGLLRVAGSLRGPRPEAGEEAEADAPPSSDAQARRVSRSRQLANFVGVWIIGVALGIYVVADLLCLGDPKFGCGLASLGYVPLWLAFGAPGAALVWILATAWSPSRHTTVLTLWGGLLACFGSAVLPWLFPVLDSRLGLKLGLGGVVVLTFLARVLAQWLFAGRDDV